MYSWTVLVFYEVPVALGRKVVMVLMVGHGSSHAPSTRTRHAQAVPAAPPTCQVGTDAVPAGHLPRPPMSRSAHHALPSWPPGVPAACRFCSAAMSPWCACRRLPVPRLPQ